MKINKIFLTLILSTFLLGGCAPFNSTVAPATQLSVYIGSCHIIGKDVYFAYNGAAYIAKNQLSGYNAQVKKKPVTNEIIVIENQDGSFTIPKN